MSRDREVNWKILISEEMENSKESWDDLVSTTLSKEEMEEKFDAGYGGSEGCSFTLWTKNRVYFPVVYDGAEWVGSVARNPCDEQSPHHGG